MAQIGLKLVSFGGDSVTDSDREKATRAVEILRRVMNHELFQKRVAEHPYTDIRIQDLAGVRTSLGQGDVLPRILGGGELLDPQLDGEVDLRIYIDRNCKNEVGHTNPCASLTIWTKASAFHRSSALGMAAHWAHEWTHLCGFVHDDRRTLRRPNSVPYAVGDLVVEVGRELGLDH